MKVCQVINALDRADAVSLCLLEADRIMRKLGHETEIYYEFADRSLASHGRPVSRLRPDAGDIVLFHYAGYSRILSRVARFQGKRGVVFHNVTPAHFFEGIPETYEFCQKATHQLPELSGLFDFGIGVSAFNARTLEDLGFDHTRVVPIAWETSGLADVASDPETLARLDDGRVHLLAVARVAPHKGLHFAVEALPEIERRLGREVRLLLVGKTSGYGAYLERLSAAVRDAGAGDRVVLAGEVSVAALRAYYESADVLLQLSEHEGFCVPLVEAMALGVPVVAALAGAVEGTLGGAGVRISDRSPAAIAAGVSEALGSRSTALVERQTERARAFSREAVSDAWKDALVWAENRPRRTPSPAIRRASVVVCTYNRGRVLGRCLEALRRLDHPELEVVVVEGPSTDETGRVLDRFPDVKRVANPTRNLSVSRNLGIAASTGDVVAFIDDDAVPDRDWLRALTEAYDDPTVGAAGGDVFGPRGDHLQFSRGILSRYGRVIAVRDEPADRNDPGGAWFNTLMGTNASFRRRALEAVGGFDENYEYYHDETDLCARIIQAGYRVMHVPEAVVWHGFEPGTARKSEHEFDFSVIVKNSIYFALCTSGWKRRPWRLLGSLGPVVVHPARVGRWLLRRNIGPSQAMRALGGCARGAVQGYRKGLTVSPRCDLAERQAEGVEVFRPYRASALRYGKSRLHVALVSQQYPPDPLGGIGAYTEQLARGLVDLGHRVSVVAAGPSAAIDLLDGVEVYRVPPAEAPAEIPLRLRVTRKNVARSLGVGAVLASLVETAGVRVVESPIWDAEGYAWSLSAEVPLVLRLNTPIALAAEMQGWDWNDDLRLAAEMEWACLRNANAVIDPSGTIVETIRSRYGVAPGDVPVESLPFGTPLPEERPPPDRDGVSFFFLGRLEPRKGIDTLVAAIPEVLRACPEARFEIAGEAVSPDTTESAVASLSAAERSRVRLHGHVDEEERARLYAECDVFVAPSRYESFGIVYLEAMAYGRPCVACGVGGPTRIVVPGETGLLVPPGDARALARALIELARDPARRREMGRAARRRVESHYGLDTMVRRTIDLYERVASDGGRASG